MRLIKPSFEILEQPSGLDGIYKMIELAGRTCYHSEDKTTEDSVKGFVERMIKSGHGAMLEHGTVYLMKKSEFINTHIHPEEGEEQECNPLLKYYDNAYSHVRQEHTTGWFVYVTTNLRVLVENDWLDDLKYVCEPTEYHEKRITVRFICSIGFIHKLFKYNILRNFSITETNSEYNDELTFIIPNWVTTITPGSYERTHKFPNMWRYDYWMESIWFYNMIECEDDYTNMIKEYLSPEQAGVILPNSLKTELVITGFISDWKKLFNIKNELELEELLDPLKKNLLKTII